MAEHEDDDLLRLFGHAEEQTLEAKRFWAEQVGSKEAKMAVQEMEGFDEVLEKFVAELPPEVRVAGLTPEQRLAGLAPEQRLAGLAPEQRMAGLPPEQVVLVLPDSILRALSPDLIAALPESTRAAIEARLKK
ncbi:MAG: hypothetical protein R3B70_05010 [Polyangiaceae bacterium]